MFNIYIQEILAHLAQRIYQNTRDEEEHSPK